MKRRFECRLLLCVVERLEDQLRLLVVNGNEK